MAQKILIVEDEKSIMKDLTVLFKKEGFEAEGFTSPQDALDYLQNHPADLICIDIVMPVPEGWPDEETEYGKKTGIVFARRAKKALPWIKMIALTVAEEPDMNREMRDAGIAKILNKPIYFNVLLEAAREMMK